MEQSLVNKHMIYLGSSVTYGAAANGVSFADFITERNKMTMTKEAVSGTTLVDDSADSYISRMKTIDPSVPAQGFMCQLSTNDATQQKPLGTVAPGFEKDTLDTHTIAGAIEYIIAYAKETWNCPVVFYTNPHYASELYGEMVRLLYAIADKWKIRIIDLWNNGTLNNIDPSLQTHWMADAIHPTREGYLEGWTPIIEQELGRILA